MPFRPILFCVLFAVLAAGMSLSGQSRRQRNFSEASVTQPGPSRSDRGRDDEDVIRVETDLVTLPIRLATKKGQPVPDAVKEEFIVFENGVQQEIDHFYNEDQPFTVALMLDMSYSSVFKLSEIQAAAIAFTQQLREHDRVLIVSFDEKVHFLCEPTNDRRILKIAIEAARIGSGTSVYRAIDEVMRHKLSAVRGRKAIVLLSDGVDTTSGDIRPAALLDLIQTGGTFVYPIKYNTFDDVRKSRRIDAEIRYDEDDRPYVFETQPGVGEREKDYAEAKEFMNAAAERSGGRLFNVSSNTNLNASFKNIADSLRKTYSLGYYPSVERRPGSLNEVKVRVMRPDLTVKIN